VLDDLPRLQAALDRGDDAGLVLVGRRHLRSNNSWMHNLTVLTKGKERCTLQVHPDDAATLGLIDGGLADVASRVGKLTAPVEVTDAIRPGVVSLPHGWGHDQPGVRLGVAAGRGVNSNLLTDGEAIDPLSGNAVLNGIPVVVSPA
jgi:anaerobic selenocysteine-containing dehydrogenase